MFGQTYSPETPPASSGYQEAMKTRSGRALGSPISPKNADYNRRPKSPKPKKTRPARAARAKGGLQIEKPLSELTKDYAIPVRDMDAWVNRPAEVRRKEAEKKNGYVARPMNSFMLYRSAFAERVKQFCKENNHQVVSQVSGASWPLEPKEVRDRYEKYATIERDNHQKAHPDYKFAPNKNANAKRRRNYDSENEASELDDPDFVLNPSRSSAAKHNRNNRYAESQRSYQSSPFDPQRQTQHALSQYNPSSWEAQNPGRPPPAMMAGADLMGQYYQQVVSTYRPGIEDVRFPRMDAPIPNQYLSQGLAGPTPPLVGLPGGDHPDLQTSSHTATPVPQEAPLDPRILQQYDPSQFAQYDGLDHNFGVPANYEYMAGHPSTGPDYQYSEAPMHPGMQTLTDGREAWNGMEAGADFDEHLNPWLP